MDKEIKKIRKKCKLLKRKYTEVGGESDKKSGEKIVAYVNEMMK